MTTTPLLELEDELRKLSKKIRTEYDTLAILNHNLSRAKLANEKSRMQTDVYVQEKKIKKLELRLDDVQNLMK